MSLEVKLDEDAVDLVHRYNKVRPSTTPVIIGRIVRTFLNRGAKPMYKNKSLRPDLEEIPEGKVTGVEITSELARRFKKVCNKLELDPINMLTWLTATFIKAHDMKKKVELNKKRDMDKR